MLSRRGFIGGLAALVGGVALEQAIPLGRVWSFPSEIKLASSPLVTIEQYADFISISDLATVWYDRRALDMLKRQFRFSKQWSHYEDAA